MKKMIFLYFFLFLTNFLPAMSQALPDAEKSELLLVIKNLKAVYAPERKVTVFTVMADTAANPIVISGEVENPEAKTAIINAASKITGNFIDSIRILPDTSLGEKMWGITRLGISHMRSKPEESAELSSQVLMGRVVKILKKRRGWSYVHSPDGYLGWMWSESFVRTTKDTIDRWNASNLARLIVFYDHLYEKMDDKSIPVTDISAGGLVKLINQEKEWSLVELPDGRSGFLKNTSFTLNAEWKKTVTATALEIEKTARLLTGVTYLWGGASVFGVDCSGFTKTVFGLHGVDLLRDADQQATMGEEVDPGDNFENVKKGDLLFFGTKAKEEKPERVTHVAIALGNKRFIHSSGFVRENSLDPASAIYDEYRLRTFVKVKRILRE